MPEQKTQMRGIVSIEVREHIDDSPDVSWLDGHRCSTDEERAFDAERLAAFNRGDWHMIGIDAIATVVVDHVVQSIVSGGLWGIESDSGDDYLRGIAGEELDALAGILRELGFTAEEISAAWPDSFDAPEPEPTLCPDCGEPISLQPSGWWSHDGLPHGCWRLSLDGPNVGDEV